MKYTKAILSFFMIACLTACGNTTQNESSNSNITATSEIISDVNMQSERTIEELKEIYPEFFGLDGEPFKGVEVYVWQMSADTYYCGLMFGTNRNKTVEEIMTLQNKALSVNETKVLINKLNFSGSVVIYPVTQPYSSFYYEIDDEYRSKISELFEGAYPVAGSLT